MPENLLFGITEGGVVHIAGEDNLDIDGKFKMVKEAGVFDYFDKTPPADMAAEYVKCSEKYELPIRTGGWYYTLGRDEDLLKQNLELGGRLGSIAHNTQISMYHADGHLISVDEVAEIYMRAYEWGEASGCAATFEIHVNMWSEDFRQVSKVADLVEARGVPYRMTLDHSHVIFKIDNPKEQDVLDIRGDVESGKLILDPFTPGNVCDEWIERGFVQHAHARAAAPNNPVNIWATYEDGSFGRGIQYPFIQPQEGEWHAEWHAENLEPWKEVLRRLMKYHATNDDSKLGQISTEFIQGVDYGAGAKYSIFDHSVACAKWLRETWADMGA